VFWGGGLVLPRRNSKVHIVFQALPNVASAHIFPFVRPPINLTGQFYYIDEEWWTTINGSVPRQSMNEQHKNEGY